MVEGCKTMLNKLLNLSILIDCVIFKHMLYYWMNNP